MNRGALVVLGLALAAGWGSPARSAEPPRFQLDLVEVDWVYLGPGPHGPFGVPLFSVDEGDIAAWDASAQRLVLRPEVTPRLLAMAQTLLPDLPDRMHRLRTLWSDRDLWSILRFRGFVVSREGRRVCRGFFVDDLGNPGLGEPKLHTEMDEGRRIVLLQIPSDCGPLGELLSSLGKPAEAPAIPPVPAPERAPVPLAVEADARNAVDGWSLYFSASEEVAAELAEIRYRLAGNSRWQSADLGRAAPLGYVGPGPRRVDVEALDDSGELLGRYTWWIDLEDEVVLRSEPPP